jgi:hypothetical protein
MRKGGHQKTRAYDKNPLLLSEPLWLRVFVAKNIATKAQRHEAAQRKQ